MLSENNKLLTWRRLRPRNSAGANGGMSVRPAVGIFRRREDLAQQAGEFFPLTILAAAAHGMSERFKVTERRDFSFQLADGARSRRLIENLLLDSLDLVI